jgi:hypothetical protein
MTIMFVRTYIEAHRDSMQAVIKMNHTCSFESVGLSRRGFNGTLILESYMKQHQHAIRDAAGVKVDGMYTKGLNVNRGGLVQ